MKKFIIGIMTVLMMMSLCSCSNGCNEAGEYKWYHDSENYLIVILDEDGTGYTEIEVNDEWDSWNYTWKNMSDNIVMNFSDGSTIAMKYDGTNLWNGTLCLEKQ